MTDVGTERYEGEQWVLNPRTSDPASTLEGERWLRTDLNSGDKIATLRVDVGSGVVDVPVFPLGTATETVREAVRLQVNGQVGYVPIAPVSDAAFPALRVQHDAEVHAFHDRVVPESALPDSVVSRDPDNTQANNSKTQGIRITTDVEWPEIDGKISSNTSGATRAYIYRVGDGQLLGDTDISSLTAGDTFTISVSPNLTSGESYNFVLDAEGAAYDLGADNSADFPYTSSDGDLSIINGADGAKGIAGNAINIVKVGNL